MAFDDQRRLFASGRGVVGVVRWIIIGVRSEAALSRKDQVLRRREIAAQRGFGGARRGLAQHFHCGACRIDRDDSGRLGKGAGAADDAAAGDPDLAEIGVGQIEWDELLRGDIEAGEVAAAVFGIGADHLPSG